MGRRYALDDPRLQDEIEQRAAETAAGWPAPDQEKRQQLARLLADPPRPARRRPDDRRRAA